MTIVSRHSVPIIEEILDELAGARWFSKLDLRAGHHQIRLAPGEEHKTAFQTHSGYFEYKVVPFGLAGAPAAFLGAMNTILHPVLRVCAMVFFDDIIVFSASFALHLQHLREVFELLWKDQWYVNRSKCEFAKQELNYLGHTISAKGVATDRCKIQQVTDWPVPATVKDVRVFLGLAGYYRHFVRHFGMIARPLTDLLHKNRPFQWTTVTGEALEALKTALVTAPSLALPDFTKPLTIEIDACEYGVGAVLQQDGHPIAYLSKVLGPRTKGLSTCEKEYMAMVLAVDQWRAYLQFSECIIKTDQKSLVHLKEQRLHTPWQQKAFTKMLGLQYRIWYRKGSEYSAADAQSRCPISTSQQMNAISICQPAWLQELTQGTRKIQRLNS